MKKLLLGLLFSLSFIPLAFSAEVKMYGIDTTTGQHKIVESGDTLPMGTIFPADPNADKYLMWDDDPGSLIWTVAGGVVEGTAVLSTGEGGGTKFLREDGDGTCSWQAAGGGGNNWTMTADSGTNQLIGDAAETVTLAGGTGITTSVGATNTWTIDWAAASTDLSDTAALLYETELDDFSELQAQIANKTLVNEEDAATIDVSWTFAAGLVGNVTGNCSGQAGTVATITGLAPDTATTAATQPNITSVGTLTTLTVDDITINANTISSGGASTLAINPTEGQSITFDGTVTLDAGVISGATSITSTSFVGALTGNADTVTTNANLTGEVTSVGNATTIADSVAVTSWNLTTPTITTSLTTSTPTTISAAELDRLDGLTSAIIDVDKINTFAELDAIVEDASLEKVVTAGRSLTKTVQDIAADAELYTDCKTLYLEDPTADDDLKTIWVAPVACTITKLHYESDQTVIFDLQIDDGTPAAVNGSDITCTTFATDSSLAGDTTMAAGDRLDLAITSVSGTPTWFSVTFEFTYDD